MYKLHVAPFLSQLVTTPHMQAMWNLRNGGVPLFVHTIDVAMLVLDAFDDWQERHGAMDLVTTITGALLHDLTKVTARATRGQPTHLSHSNIMLHDPSAAVAEAHAALRVVRDATGIVLDRKELDLMAHIIMSHHGPWGSVAPRCAEAALVHYCDLYSARFHRTPPVDANDILALLDAGHSKAAAARVLGVTTQTITKRLEEARRAEWLDSPAELLAVWRRRGHVAAGDEDAIAHREEIRLRAIQAEAAPQPLLEHRVFRFWLENAD
jgi:hypothetical protein